MYKLTDTFVLLKRFLLRECICVYLYAIILFESYSLRRSDARRTGVKQNLTKIHGHSRPRVLDLQKADEGLRIPI